MQTPTLTDTPAVSETPLTALDRCDRCQAQAFVIVTSKVTGHDLLFCGHHFGRFEVHFTDPAWVVRDERHRINRTASSSANA